MALPFDIKRLEPAGDRGFDSARRVAGGSANLLVGDDFQPGSARLCEWTAGAAGSTFAAATGKAKTSVLSRNAGAVAPMISPDSKRCRSGDRDSDLWVQEFARAKCDSSDLFCARKSG